MKEEEKITMNHQIHFTQQHSIDADSTSAENIESFSSFFFFFSHFTISQVAIKSFVSLCIEYIIILMEAEFKQKLPFLVSKMYSID